jgi:hypothetical protein
MIMIIRHHPHRYQNRHPPRLKYITPYPVDRYCR